MYRGVTFEVLRRGLEATDIEAVGRVAREIHFVQTRHSLQVNGVDATAEIRTPAVDAAVSHVAANSAVREVLRTRQREWIAEHGGGVVEGRDISLDCQPQLPTGVNRATLVIARCTLHANHRSLVEIGDRSGTRIGARRAHASHDLVDDVFDAGSLRVEIHARGADSLFEQFLTGAIDRSFAAGAVTHGTV
ncbi:MAG: hypothetical protein EBW27_03855 [Acidimicrobiia bacterium]|nr:hypothetical protein [Acidimicrobiia bacterium]